MWARWLSVCVGIQSKFSATNDNIACDYRTNSCKHFKYCDSQYELTCKRYEINIHGDRICLCVYVLCSVHTHVCLFICLLGPLLLAEMSSNRINYAFWNGRHHSIQFYLNRNKMRFLFQEHWSIAHIGIHNTHIHSTCAYVCVRTQCMRIEMYFHTVK